MKITKEEYTKFAEQYNKIEEELYEIAQLRNFSFDEIYEVSEDRITLQEAVYDNCGGGYHDTVYHHVTFDELSMDREGQIEEVKRLKDIQDKKNEEQRLIRIEKEKIDQKNRDINQFNILKKRLNR